MRTIVSLRWVVALAAALGAAPALAQSASFSSITLSPGFANAAGEAQGYTQGSFSLSSIANRDRAGNLCLGFSDSTPDHILVLQQDFSRLSVQVDSGGGDTTLLIQGPNNTVRCGDDTGSNTDASLQDTNWQSGEYRVWVGSFDANVRYDYTLRIRE
jgi:hypothetical protein